MFGLCMAFEAEKGHLHAHADQLAADQEKERTQFQRTKEAMSKVQCALRPGRSQTVCRLRARSRLPACPLLATIPCPPPHYFVLNVSSGGGGVAFVWCSRLQLAVEF